MTSERNINAPQKVKNATGHVFNMSHPKIPQFHPQSVSNDVSIANAFASASAGSHHSLYQRNVNNPQNNFLNQHNQSHLAMVIEASRQQRQNQHHHQQQQQQQQFQQLQPHKQHSLQHQQYHQSYHRHRDQQQNHQHSDTSYYNVAANNDLNSSGVGRVYSNSDYENYPRSHHRLSYGSTSLINEISKNSMISQEMVKNEGKCAESDVLDATLKRTTTKKRKTNNFQKSNMHYNRVVNNSPKMDSNNINEMKWKLESNGGRNLNGMDHSKQLPKHASKEKNSELNQIRNHLVQKNTITSQNQNRYSELYLEFSESKPSTVISNQSPTDTPTKSDNFHGPTFSPLLVKDQTQDILDTKVERDTTTVKRDFSKIANASSEKIADLIAPIENPCLAKNLLNNNNPTIPSMPSFDRDDLQEKEIAPNPYIYKILPNDVLWGTTKRTLKQNHKEHNSHYLDMIEKYTKDYGDASNSHKADDDDEATSKHTIAWNIVRTIKAKDPPGRFIRLQGGSKEKPDLVQIEDDEVVKKIKVHLRDSYRKRKQKDISNNSVNGSDIIDVERQHPGNHAFSTTQQNDTLSKSDDKQDSSLQEDDAFFCQQLFMRFKEAEKQSRMKPTVFAEKFLAFMKVKVENQNLMTGSEKWHHFETIVRKTMNTYMKNRLKDGQTDAQEDAPSIKKASKKQEQFPSFDQSYNVSVPKIPQSSTITRMPQAVDTMHNMNQSTESILI